MSPNNRDAGQEGTKFDFKPSTPVDVANLTIKQRIALMQGKDVNGQPKPLTKKPSLYSKPQLARKPDVSAKTSQPISAASSMAKREEPRHLDGPKLEKPHVGYGSKTTVANQKVWTSLFHSLLAV